MIALHLTENQVAFLQTNLKLFAMNNPRDSWEAEIILELLNPSMPSIRQQLESVFADLYPAGGRE